MSVQAKPSLYKSVTLPPQLVHIFDAMFTSMLVTPHDVIPTVDMSTEKGCRVSLEVARKLAAETELGMATIIGEDCLGFHSFAIVAGMPVEGEAGPFEEFHMVAVKYNDSQTTQMFRIDTQDAEGWIERNVPLEYRDQVLIEVVGPEPLYYTFTTGHAVSQEQFEGMWNEAELPHTDLLLPHSTASEEGLMALFAMTADLPAIPHAPDTVRGAKGLDGLGTRTVVWQQNPDNKNVFCSFLDDAGNPALAMHFTDQMSYLRYREQHGFQVQQWEITQKQNAAIAACKVIKHSDMVKLPNHTLVAEVKGLTDSGGVRIVGLFAIKGEPLDYPAGPRVYLSPVLRNFAVPYPSSPDTMNLEWENVLSSPIATYIEVDEFYMYHIFSGLVTMMGLAPKTGNMDKGRMKELIDAYMGRVEEGQFKGEVHLKEEAALTEGKAGLINPETQRNILQDLTDFHSTWDSLCGRGVPLGFDLTEVGGPEQLFKLIGPYVPKELLIEGRAHAWDAGKDIAGHQWVVTSELVAEGIRTTLHYVNNRIVHRVYL